MATPRGTGTASSKASREDASVPKIIGAAPNTPATGSHTDVHTNRSPNRLIAGHAPTTSSASSVRSSSGSTSASAVRVMRYSRSPRFIPRKARHGDAGAGAGGRTAFGVVAGSMGSVVKREGYRAAVVQTGLPPAVIVLSRASTQGRSCLGRGAYPSGSVRAWPSVSAHQTNFTRAVAFAASSYCLWSRSHAKLAMRYALSPSWLVIDTRKSVPAPIVFIAPAAAAVMLWSSGVMNLPALLRTLPAGSLLIMA